jgi:hypothetical protein
MMAYKLLIPFLVWGFGAYSQDTGKFARARVNVCKRLIKIDSTEYRKNFVLGTHPPETSLYQKINGVIAIETPKEKLQFKDDTSLLGPGPGGNYIVYNVYGMDISKNIIFVTSSTENDNEGFLISISTGKVDTVLDLPLIYGDRILSCEARTDSPFNIQLAQYSKDGLSNIIHFYCADCEENTSSEEIFLKGNFIYVKDYWDNFYKFSVDE